MPRLPPGIIQALFRDYLPPSSLNKALLRHYFLWPFKQRQQNPEFILLIVQKSQGQPPTWGDEKNEQLS